MGQQTALAKEVYSTSVMALNKDPMIGEQLVVVFLASQVITAAV